MKRHIDYIDEILNIPIGKHHDLLTPAEKQDIIDGVKSKIELIISERDKARDTKQVDMFIDN